MESSDFMPFRAIRVKILFLRSSMTQVLLFEYKGYDPYSESIVTYKRDTHFFAHCGSVLTSS